MEEKSNAYRVLVRKSDGKRPLRRLKLRWEGHIRIILKQTDASGLDEHNSGQGQAAGGRLV
jgi:hypothetical protein